MTSEEMRPGNPLRVPCRTSRAATGAGCVWPIGQQPHRRKFHGKRCRDARQDFITNGKTVIVGTRQTRAGGRIRGAMRSMRASAPIASLGEAPGVERALSEVSRSALDMQQLELWSKVWSDDDTITDEREKGR